MKGLELEDGIFEVPLPEPIMAMLKERFEKRVSSLIFSSQKPGKPLYAQTLLNRTNALAKLKMTNHGFRATYGRWVDDRTICEEQPKEMVLGHGFGDQTKKAYRRSDWFEKRRLLLEVWSDYLVSGVDRVVDVNTMFLQRFEDRAAAEQRLHPKSRNAATVTLWRAGHCGELAT